ncbi:toprim domain-containing protein [Actinomadura adrarensis]|uniref:Toprim domain-containing protein n=1 Tax=Actinomadura adrarensis TaxID=1819600 RepID=A0ABW3CRR7_9ACTN
MTTPPPTPGVRNRDAEELQRRVEILHGIAASELARLSRGQLTWEQWLTHAHHHGRYGFTNTLLIAAQRPTATDVRSYEDWKRQGRQVLRGQSAIRVLSRSGKPRPVFDVEQTDGQPLGEPASVSPGQAYDRLRRLASDLELYVDRGQRWSYSGRPERRIMIAPQLADAEAATLLAHQLAHVLQRGERIDLDEPCQGVRRVRADSIAYLVLAAIGMDVDHLSFASVQSWAGKDARANPHAAIRTVGEKVLRVASRIRQRLPETSMNPPPQGPAVPHPKQAPEHENLLAAQTEAHAFFRAHHSDSWAPGYLAERGFEDGIQERWQIGYAPAGRRTLIDHLTSRGFSDETLVAAGLAKRGRDGTLFDIFRDRVMLPLRAPDGAVVGFIGRRRDDAPGPKYLNTPETSIFRKGEVLFGLHEGRDRLQQGARPLVVEGPFDAIAIDSATIDDHVPLAPCGTAITTNHLDQIAKCSDIASSGLLLALDGDNAGSKAMQRAWGALKQIAGPVEAVCLPEGRDPADIFRNHGCDGVREALHSIVRLADLVVDAAIDRVGGTLEFAENRLAAARTAANLIAQMRAPEVARQILRVAERTGLGISDMNAILAVAISPGVTPTGVSAATEDFPLAPLTRTDHEDDEDNHSSHRTYAKPSTPTHTNRGNHRERRAAP